MKTPSLLLLLAVAISPAFGEDAPARCDVAWLKAAQAVPAGGAISDPNKYLTTAADGKTQTLDPANPTKLCDATVWHYLAVLGPAGEPILDPTTRKPIGGLTLHWNNPATQQAWSRGLSDQIKILLAATEHYQRVDALGRDALTKADAVVSAATASGIVARTDGATPAALEQPGYTAHAYAGDKGYTVAALTDAQAAAAAPADPAALKDSFAALLQQTDGRPARTVKNRAGKTVHLAAKPAGPLKPGAAVLNFQKSVVALANEVRSDRSGQAAFKDADYAPAVKFITDSAITKADESGAYPSAALSELDYGLRNLLALRSAAVDSSVAAAKARLHGSTISALLAAAQKNPQLPQNQSSADMAAAVLRHLQGVQDYKDLNALYENNKNNAQWVASDDGKAVAAQLEGYRRDAAATTVVAGANGRVLQYSVGQQKVTDTGISVADLDRSLGYREMIADAVARDITSNPLGAKVQAVLAAFRGNGASGTPLTSLPGKVEELPLKQLPVVPAVLVTAPPNAYDALVKATPAQGFLGRLFNRQGNVERYYSKVNEDAAAVADGQASQRAQFESAANDAADAERAARADERAKLVAAPHDPDVDMTKVLAKFDAETRTDADAAYNDFMAKHKGSYVSQADANAALAASRKKLDDTVDAAYSDGISRALAGLNAEYKQMGSSRQKYAAKKSGYDGHAADGTPYYRTERVDLYFTNHWGDKTRPKSIEDCKAALGFKRGGDSGDFKDPSEDNVDKVCGVRVGLVKELASYAGKK